MKPQSMEEKISYRLFFMGFVGLVCTAVLCLFVFHKAFREQAWTSLEHQADLVSAGYEQLSSPDQLSVFVNGDLRITLIAADGSVVFESATDQQMENHLSRPEIQQAMREGVGRNCRDSQTMGYETYYYAMLLPGGDILRVAQDSETIWSIYDAALPAIILSCILMMGAAALIAGLLTRSLVQPILKMTDDLEHIQENVPYRELIPFAESIHSDRLLRENNEKMRQDFTANVSHELKTPLTSISGYAELIETGMAKSADVPTFAARIHKEAQRMIALVSDILQLSELDSTQAARGQSAPPDMVPVDLASLVKEIAQTMTVNARKAYVTLQYDVHPATVQGCRDQLVELATNLCDNAIRYNRPGGHVDLRCGTGPDGCPYLEVEDNGIGIPQDSQSRVFERFYRVDKSRSKATGGTGLGLAIVKHIALLHDAHIDLQSQVGTGTTIKVTFPKNS